jgi:3-oxoacyl-[acyl-carrier protein] reductase
MVETERSRVVVITGGNSGIGLGIAEGFARQNAQLVIIGRNQETLTATAQRLGNQTLWLRADISKSQEIDSALEKIAEKFPTVDVLVNAAGFMRTITTAMDTGEAEALWNEVIDTNLKGSFLMSIAIAKRLRRPGGRIINISSIGSFTGGSQSGGLAYASSKASLNGLTFALARELSPKGITVNAIAPGFIGNTGFTGAWPKEIVDAIVSQIPTGRAGEVSDIAEAALFLASPKASFITGEILNVH